MRKIISATIFGLLIFIITCCSSQGPELRFKAIYLDMDGTTLSSNYEIRPATVAALDAFRHCGGLLGIVTGRSPIQVQPYLHKLKPNLPLVLYNGGLIVDPQNNKVLVKTPLESKTIHRIVETAAGDEDVRAILAHYTDSLIVNDIAPDIEEFLKKQNCPEPRLCPELLTCVKEVEDVKDNLPIKLQLYVKPTTVENVAKRVMKKVGENVRVLVSSPETIELVPKKVDKADALRYVFDKFNLDPNELVIFGDSGNDVRMLGEFPVTMAMGNCRKETCDAALFKIGTNDTDAIANTIRRLVLLPGCEFREKVTLQK